MLVGALSVDGGSAGQSLLLLLLVAPANQEHLLFARELRLPQLVGEREEEVRVGLGDAAVLL